MNLLQKRIQQLESEIKEASQKYYEDGSSDLTDAEFDQKVDELRALDADASVLHQTGWGYNVDEDSTPGQKYPHKYGPAGSLDKIRTGEEFRRAFGIGKDTPSYQYTASLKLDGISVVLYYEHGVLVRALTRGDGKIGIDITEKIKVINNDLSMINAKWFTGAIRGEIVMSYHNFDRIKDTHPEFKNPRNATAGLINRKDISDDLCFLNVVVYSVVGWEFHPNINPVYNEDCMWSFLEDQFLYTAPRSSYLCLTSNNIDVNMDMFQMKWYGKYPADGIVITKQLNTDQLPYVTYESVAYKFPSEIKETTVVYVEWNMSKTGYIIPRVKVEPVELAGTTVQYATGFNADYIKNHWVGRSAKIQITKRGEIIPYIVSVLEPAVVVHLPETCPDCGQPLVWNGVHLQCINRECPNIHRQDLSDWLEALAPVDGLQDALRTKYLEQMIGKSDVTIDDVMDLAESLSTNDAYLMLKSDGHEGLMKQMFAQLVDVNRKYSIGTALRALNIPRFGDVTCDKFGNNADVARKILYSFSTAPYHDEIENAVPSEVFEDYTECVTYIGFANAKTLWEYRYKLHPLLKYLWDKIEWSITEPQYKGKIAVTGKLSCRRADFEKELKSAGYQLGEIAKDTMFLITDNENSNSAKTIFARNHNIRMMSEKEFRKTFNIGV